MQSPPPESPASMQNRSQLFIALLDELARMRGRTTSAFRGLPASFGLSELESVVLSAVVGATRPPTVPQIGRSLGHARQVIQRATEALSTRGLVATRENPDHKRARLLVATPAGQALKRSADLDGLELASALTDGLDRTLLARVVGDLHEVRGAIERNLQRMGRSEEGGEEE